MALVLGDLDEPARVSVHVHTECLVGDALGFEACGCRSDLRESMTQISEAGTGVLLYLRAPGGDAARLRHLAALAGREPESSAGRPNDGVAISILRDLGVDADRAVLA
jgi:3,4-dihydroxy 2-butanone 4-phosphate synthase/GTP cyclohydrolase II